MGTAMHNMTESKKNSKHRKKFSFRSKTYNNT